MADTQVSASLLGIYLNDHLAGATAGLELFRRAAGGQRGTEAGEQIAGMVGQIEEDRESLLMLMRALSVPVRHYKVLAGWAVEKAGRFKPNGGLVNRSPLSNLVELEALRLGVEGKAALWSSLAALARDGDPRLDSAHLGQLRERADAQIELLERLRVDVAREVLSAG